MLAGEEAEYGDADDASGLLVSVSDGPGDSPCDFRLTLGKCKEGEDALNVTC